MKHWFSTCCNLGRYKEYDVVVIIKLEAIRKKSYLTNSCTFIRIGAYFLKQRFDVQSQILLFETEIEACAKGMSAVYQVI
jgi:hypothetical protein